MSNSPRRRETNRLWRRRQRAKLAAQGICPRCGKNPSREHGKPWCQVCIDRRRALYRNTGQAARVYQQRRARGVCAQCQEPSEEFHRCDRCRELQRAWRIKHGLQRAA